MTLGWQQGREKDFDERETYARDCLNSQSDTVQLLYYTRTFEACAAACEGSSVAASTNAYP